MSVVAVCALGLLTLTARDAHAQNACSPQWATGLFAADSVDGTVRAITSHDNGSGPALYVAGDFQLAGGTTANNIARFDGHQWSPLSSGTDDVVRSVVFFDDGSGPALYAAGDFTSAGGTAVNYIAKWDGNSWTNVGGGTDGFVRSLAVFDDGSGEALYAGGSFSNAGGSFVGNIARWDGTSWSDVGGGMDGSFPTVYCLTVSNDGSAQALYAGGGFETAGGTSVNRVAKWDGSQWSALGNGMNNSVLALHGSEVGSESGPVLYAGGYFTTAGSSEVARVAMWDGSEWSALGDGVGGIAIPRVLGLTTFDDGSGPALYAAGVFTTAGTTSANYIARWDGNAWSALDGGIDGSYPFATCLDVFDWPTGPALYVGGQFSSAGGSASNNIAKWFVSNVTTDFDCDGDVDADDWTTFEQCSGGPALPYATSCTLPTDDQDLIAIDFDQDGDVDQADFGVFQLCFSGEDIPAIAGCEQ